MTSAATIPRKGRLRDRRRARTWSDGLLTTDPVVKVMVLLLPLVRLLMVLPVSPSVYPDGRTYRQANTWLDFSWTSFDGYSVRPWGVTVWMALWPGDRAIMLAQALLSGVAWATFAVVIARGIGNRVVRRLFVLAIVLLACSAQLANWDSVIQGDSLPMSTGILALAALVWLVREPTWGRAGLFAAAALWFSMTRPNTFVVLLVWAVGLLAIGLLRRRVLVLGVTAAVLLAFCGYSYLYNMRSDAAWTDRMGWARTTVGMAYPLGRYDPVAAAVLRDLKKTDAPTCLFPPNAAAVTAKGTTAWIATRVAECPGVDEWASKNWQSWWINWLVQHPSSALTIVKSQLPESLAPSVWGNVVAATPDSVSELFLGTRKLPQDAHPQQSYRTQPLIFWFAASGALALVARSRRLWRGTPWGVDLALVATVLGGLGSAVSSGLLIQTVPHEVAQESLGATAVITASAVALVAVGFDRVLSRRPAETAVLPDTRGPGED
jgi:hypothetical protein